jgi:signal transduction histidine kinase
MNGEGRERGDPAEKVRVEERHRLALYLHDNVAQVLSLAKLQLARIQHALREPLDVGKQAWLQTTLDLLIPELDAAMQAVREEVFSLNPVGLTEVGLTAALEQECVAFSRRTGIPCKGRCEAQDLDAQRGALVVLIVREALANIARHSRATTAEVALQRSGQQGILLVRDNGIGIDALHTRGAESIGIRGMEERARRLRGVLTIDSTPSKGTQIRLSFPLAPRPKTNSPSD